MKRVRGRLSESWVGRCPRFNLAWHPAFTLVELLVVISIVGVLASLLLPTLAQAKARAKGIFCLNNSRQLMLAWAMYADDEQERLVSNLGTERSNPIVVTNWDANWVNNTMTWE